jgi:hypothetical protein
MRYMLLIYSREVPPADLTEQQRQETREGHRKLMEAAAAKGIFHGAEPLQSVATATTVRQQHGKVLVTDGPFAETKEQLAGYYILDCKDLDEAISWAARIPTTCWGGSGCVEIRPIRSYGDTGS